MTHLGIFGGTFDPIHYGHLRSAVELREALSLEQVRMIPCHNPPHRDPPQASSEHRLAMLQLALQGSQGLVADDRELRRNRYSYTINTLETFRREQPDRRLMLIVGADAFSGFTAWHRWEDILDLADVVVMARPGSVLSGDAEDILRERQVMNIAACRGAVGNVLMRQLTQLDISSTRIRGWVASGHSVEFLLPRRVQEYIREHRLYAG